MKVDTVLHLIEDIYEAGAHPDHWKTTLRHLADATGNSDATMGGQTAAQVPLLISARTDPDYVRSYAEYYHVRNPMQMAVFHQPVGTVVLDATVVGPAFHKSEFFNDWCRPQGYLAGAAINLAASGGWRATMMVSGPNEHSDAETKLLRAVAPHLCRAFQLNQVLHDSRSLGLGAMAALEYVDRGAFIVDRNGFARPVNAIAERILGLQDGLYLRDGHLNCAIAGETAALGRAITNCERGNIEASGASLTVTRSAERSPLAVLCIPFPASQWWPGFEQQAAIIFVTDRDARLEQQTRRLRQRYGLTAAEASLVWEIARTGGRRSAAASRGVSVATARSQLSSIFDKTGVRRQAEVVQLLQMTDGAEDG